MDTDVEQLRTLSIFHYVVGGLAALFSLFPVIHLVIGLTFVMGGFETHDEQFPAQLFGWFFVVIASVIILSGLTFATCLILAGRFLARHTHYTFCLVMAGIACAFLPFGTVLGIFTILVLQRTTVRELFGQTATAARPAP